VQFTHTAPAFKAFAKRRAFEMWRVQMLAADPPEFLQRSRMEWRSARAQRLGFRLFYGNGIASADAKSTLMSIGLTLSQAAQTASLIVV
jgi:hypothetical protein